MEEIQKLVALLQSDAMDKKSLVVVPTDWRWAYEGYDVPQSFFRNEKLIAAVQAAKSGELSLRNSAAGIHDAVMESGLEVPRPGGACCLYAEFTASKGFNQEELDRWIIDLFEVVEVTGPAVVTRDFDSDQSDLGGIGASWELLSLREELVQLMDRMAKPTAGHASK